MRNMRVLFSAVLVLAAAGALAAGEAPPATDQEKAVAELNLLLDVGGKLMEGLKPDENMSKSAYMQVQFDEKPCGYDIHLLSAHKKDKSVIYDYSQEMKIKFTNGSRMALKVTATLTPFFQPLEIHVAQSQTPPPNSGAADHSSDVIVKFNEKGIEVTTLQDGDRKIKNYEAIEGGYVFATDMLLRLLEVKNADRFAIREFNATTGQADLTVFRKVSAEKAFSLRTLREGQKSEDYYNFDAKGIIFESGKVNPPFSEKLGTKEFIEALKPIIDK